MAGRVFISGGSGFIGTNLVEYFSAAGFTILNFDTVSPRNAAHTLYWRRGNICDPGAIQAAIADFRPNVILHAAARTDLNGSTLEDYAANTDGVKNVIAAARLVPNLVRIVFFSSMLVCDVGYMPRHESDYRPTTVYGRSKMHGEQIVRALPTTELPWLLVRPTSIWGPWFGAPYRAFFEAVRAGWFMLPRDCRTVRSYGYAANLVAQVASLISARPADVIGRTFYLADYDPLLLSRWANAISHTWGKGPIREAPLNLLRCAALFGDGLQKLGYVSPPLTSFRLSNLLTSAVFDTSAIAQLCPVLPISMDEGVRLTVEWLQNDAARGVR